MKHFFLYLRHLKSRGSLLLSLLMICLNFPLWSATMASELKEIDGLWYYLSVGDYTAKVTWKRSTPTSTSHLYYSGAISIPETFIGPKDMEYTVTAIDQEAFLSCSGLTSISLPSTLETIGESAFKNCTGISMLVIPNLVDSIGTNAFYGCDKLSAITLPVSLNRLSNSVFENCSLLTSVTIPNQVSSIGNKAFSGCKKLTNVSIPAGVETIGENAFSGCSSLPTITLSQTLRSIGSNAFMDCSALSTVAMNEALQTIGSQAFMNCSQLSSVVVPNSVTSLGISAFKNCINLTSATIGDGITTINNYSFWNCHSLITLSLGSSVQTIGEMAFDNCRITSIDIPNTISTIGSKAFRNCISLASVSVGAGLTNIASDAFDYCPALTNLIYKEGTEQILPMYATHITNVTIPSTAKTIVQRAFYYCSNLTEVYAPSVETISTEAFAECTALANLRIPVVSTIGEKAFYDCSSLTTVTIPRTAQSIGQDAFARSGLSSLVYEEGCTTGLRTYATGISSVTIPSTMSRFADRIFEGCTNLESVYISSLEMWNFLFLHLNNTPFPNPHKLYLDGNLLTTLNADFGCEVSNYAFYQCKGLQIINLTGSMTGIGTNAFAQCSDLKAVAMGSQVATIGEGAFMNCASLESVHMGRGTINIGNNAFSGCSNLSSVLMGGNEQTIGDGAFDGCSALADIMLSPAITRMGQNCFRGCTSLRQIEIPAGVTEIKTGSFERCKELQSVSFPQGLVSVGASAFHDCDRVKEILLHNSVTSLGANCFDSCDSLRYLYLGTGVANISSKAIANCGRLNGIYCYAVTPPTASNDAFAGSDPEYIPLYVPDESLSVYTSTSPWNQFKETISGLSSAPKYVTNIALNPSVITLREGEDANIEAVVTPSDATNSKVTWSTSNADVVFVTQRGYVEAYMEGIATITASASDKNGARSKCLVIVSNHFQPISQISLSANDLTMKEGGIAFLQAMVAPVNATYGYVDWSSSDTEVAKVSNVGVVTAFKAGTTTITCRAADGSGVQAVCRVTVTEPVDPTIGDATGDGQVSIKDITRVIQYVQEAIERGEDISLFDMDGDGEITEADIPGILNIIMGGGETIKVLELHPTSMTIGIGDTCAIAKVVIPYRLAASQILWTSSDPEVASVSSTGIVTGHAIGMATITAATTDGSGIVSTCEVSVERILSGSTDGHTWVDLGLPSGTRWSTVNLGAATPDASGDYYAWGETEPSDSYSWADYQYCDGSATTLNKYCSAASSGTRDELTVLEAGDDAANQAWGENWRMPSPEQFAELVDPRYTTMTWTQMNNVTGMRIASKLNDSFIFIPAAGYKTENGSASYGSGGYYASNELYFDDPQKNLALQLASTGANAENTTFRCCGQSIRPVISSTVTVSPTDWRIKTDSTLTLSAVVNTPEGSSNSVQWSSSDVNIATVSSNGVVTPVGIGNVIIYATSEHGLVGYSKGFVTNLPEPTEQEVDLTLEDWTSTNKSHNSYEEHTYHLPYCVNATISFDWQVSSEDGDRLIVTIDGTQVLKKSGSESGHFSQELGAGDHMMIAKYTKNRYESSGSDMGKLYNVKLSGTTVGYGDLGNLQYLELSYIEGNGGYFLTDYYGKSTSSYEMQINPTSGSSTCGIMSVGRYDNGASYGMSLSAYFSSSSNQFKYYRNTSSYYSASTFQNGNDYYIEFSPTTGLTVNTNSYTSGSSSWSSSTSSYSLSVFAKYSSYLVDSPFKGKMYYFKVYEGETLVRHYVGAIRISDGVIGLYDKVNNEFLFPKQSCFLPGEALNGI